jgi:diguanylate cyclase (GGDEF)-like protein
MGTTISLILWGFSFRFISTEIENKKSIERIKTISELNLVQSRIEHELNARLYLNKGFEAYVKLHNEVENEHFTEYAKILIDGDSLVKNVSLIKDTTIVDVYPHKGNEQAIGSIIVGVTLGILMHTKSQLKQIALYDSLTNLCNRASFYNELSMALKNAEANKQKVAILFMDINKFKLVNDNYGHAVGDLLLIGVADRLKIIMDKSYTIARIGGDEFTIIVPYKEEKTTIESIMEKAKSIYDEPFIFGDISLQVTGSIGYSIYPDHSKDIDKLMIQADEHMYKEKKLV